MTASKIFEESSYKGFDYKMQYHLENKKFFIVFIHHERFSHFLIETSGDTPKEAQIAFQQVINELLISETASFYDELIRKAKSHRFFIYSSYGEH